MPVIVALLLVVLVAGVLGWGPAQVGGPNPLAGVFPYGVYIGYALSPMMGREAGDRDFVAQCRYVIEDLETHHLNCVWANNNDLDSGLQGWLQAARGSTVKVIFQGGGGASSLGWRSGAELDRFLDEQMIPLYGEMMPRYRDEPALLAYCLTEEIPAATLPGVARMTRWLEEYDPRHPGIVLYNNARTGALACRQVRPRAVAIDIYPFYSVWGEEASRSYFLHNVSLLAGAAQEVPCPLWVMGQAMSLHQRSGVEEVWQDQWREPTAAELRFQVWGALYCGAKGFFWFVYHSQAPETGEAIQGLVQPGIEETSLMREVSSIGAQIEPLYATILDWQPAVPEHDSVYFSYQSDVQARTFESADQSLRYVLAVNTSFEQARPLAKALLYHQPDCDIFDLRSLTRIGLERAAQLELEPGDGALLLIGSQEDFDRYRRRFREP